MIWVGIYTFLTKYIYMKVIADKQVTIIVSTLKNWENYNGKTLTLGTNYMSTGIHSTSEIWSLYFIQSPVNSEKSISYNLWHGITSKENESTSCI